MLSSTLTPCRSRVVVPAPLVKDTVGGHQCVALEQTFAIRGQVRDALPDFRIEKTDREGQRSTAGFDSANGLPSKEEALAEVDSEDLAMSGGDGSATGNGLAAFTMQTGPI